MTLAEPDRGQLRWLWVVRVWMTAILLAFASWASAEERPLLRVGYVDFPPIEYRDDAGQPRGLLTDLTRKVAEAAGFDLQFLHLPVSRVYHFLDSGEIDLWPGMTRIPRLKEAAIASRISGFRVPLRAWHFDHLPPVDHFEDLSGRTVILITGYTYGGLRDYLYEREDIRVSETPTHRSAIEMLQRGRGDYLLNYEQPMLITLQESPVNGLQSTLVRYRYSAWLFSRQHPESEARIAAFEAAYQRLLEAGEVPEPYVDEGPAQAILPGFPQSVLDLGDR